MSYCRFGSEDFQCDLYIYESVHGGFVTHVAGNRTVFTEALPDPVPFSRDRLDDWLARHYRVMALLQTAQREPIELQHAGETLFDERIEDLQARLIELKELGYRYPEYVDAALAAELTEQQTEATEGIVNGN